MSPVPTFSNPALYSRLRTAGSVVPGCLATVVVSLSAVSYFLPNS